MDLIQLEGALASNSNLLTIRNIWSIAIKHKVILASLFTALSRQALRYHQKIEN